jgi:hypothetical protein
VLAFGDSIVADTMRSGWLAKLGAAYPKAKIRGTVYVRGGGGCQHYKEEGRMAKNIVPRKPDLVFIGIRKGIRASAKLSSSRAPHCPTRSCSRPARSAPPTHATPKRWRRRNTPAPANTARR